MLKYSFKRLGVWLLILTFLFAVFITTLTAKTWEPTSLYGVVFEMLGFISLSLIAFSREKRDDEFLNHLRIRSIIITVLLSFIYAIFDSFFFHVSHLLIMEIFQLQILVYIIVFNILKRTNDQ